MLDTAKHTPALRLEILQQQIREAVEWDARPAALRRFRWLREAAAILRDANAAARDLVDRTSDTDCDAKFRRLMVEADALWELFDPLADLIMNITGGEEAAADLDLIETLLQGEG